MVVELVLDKTCMLNLQARILDLVEGVLGTLIIMVVMEEVVSLLFLIPLNQAK